MEKRTILVILIIFFVAITFGCTESAFTSKHTVEVTLRTVDIGFRDGSYQQVNNVMGWETVEIGTFSDTVDMKILNQDYYVQTRRIHYVTSIDIIKEWRVTLELDEGQYQSVMNA